MVQNVISAFLLDAEFYSDVAEDRSLLRQATAVVVIANLVAGIGAGFATVTHPLIGAIAGVATGVVGWLVWSGVALVVGTRILGGDSDLPEMLRVIGFAYAPLAIGVVPWLGFVGAAWVLFGAVVAIRESMGFSTKRAVATTAVGWAAWLGIAVAINAVLGLDLLLPWRIT
ncbi:MAG: YIP1 family protein [Actinomycetota bacterium]